MNKVMDKMLLNKKYKHAKVLQKSNYVYVEACIKGFRYRFSTKKLVSEENLQYVERNYLRLIEEYNKEKLEREAFLEYHSISEYGKYALDLELANKKETTKARYNSLFKVYIQKNIGEVAIETFTHKDAQILFATTLQEASTINKKTILTILKRIFNQAILEGFYQKTNPFDCIKVTQALSTIQENRNKPFTLMQMQKILRYLKTIDKQDSYRLYILKHRMQLFLNLAFFTGMRIGELLCLKYEDIDIEHNVIYVNKTIYRNTISYPKTKDSIREVEIIKPLREFLKTLDLTKEKGYIFTIDKRIISICQINNNFKTILKMLGMENRSLHSTRHTFASITISNGEEITWVSTMLGHKDASTTLKSYAKYIKTHKNRGAYFLAPLDSKNTRQEDSL